MDIVIFGTSKISDIVFSYMKEESFYNVVGFCVDRKYINKTEKFGLPVVAFDEVEKHFPPDKYKMLVAVGYHIEDNELNGLRAQKAKAVKDKNYELISYIDKGANISPSAEIGENCIILDNVSIGPFVKIGNNVCIYSNATIAHHSVIEDNVWVTSGTVVGGNSKIGKNTFLGINSTIGHNVTIGKENFIGAKALLTKDTDQESVYIVPDTTKYRLKTIQFIKVFKFE